MTPRANARLVVHLAASGGGHVELLTSLGAALSDFDCVWIMPPTPRASALQRSGAEVRLVPDPGRSLPRIVRNIKSSLRAVMRDRPRVVITSGAGSVVAFSVFARLRGADVIFIETMARVTNQSKSGYVLSRIASSVLVQWPEMEHVYRASKVCRPALCEEVAPTRTPGKGTFVAVGTHSEPFDRLLKLVDEAVGSGLLPEPVVAQAGVSTFQPRHYKTVQWLAPEEIDICAARAQYVICHAGSGLIGSALRAGRRPLVLARLRHHGEHFDDHQLQIVNRLADLDLVVPLGSSLSPEDLRRADAHLSQPSATSGLPSVEDALGEALAGALGNASAAAAASGVA